MGEYALIMAGFGLLLASLLMTLALIDLKHMILPDRLNLCLALGGLGQSAVLGHPVLTDALLGGVFASALLAGVAILFRRRRGYDGLGMGDVKLVGAGGLWIGIQAVPLMLLVASMTALVYAMVQMAWEGSYDRMRRIPFGPFLAGGLFVAWMVRGRL